MINFINIDYNIYLNVKLMCDNRGIIINNYKEISISEFNTIKKATKFFVLNGSKNEMQYQITILYSGITNQIKKDLLNNLNKFIGKKILIHSANIKISNWENIEILEGERYFSYNWLENAIYKGIKIRLVSQDEIDKLFENYFIEKNKLPQINYKCHEVVWNGFEINDIIEIIFPSVSSSNITDRYLLVTNV